MNHKYAMTSVQEETSSTAQDIIQQANAVANNAELAASRLRSKLAPIILIKVRAERLEENRPEREFPPLFNDLRDILNKIECSLADIDELTSMAEL